MEFSVCEVCSGSAMCSFLLELVIGWLAATMLCFVFMLHNAVPATLVVDIMADGYFY